MQITFNAAECMQGCIMGREGRNDGGGELRRGEGKERQVFRGGEGGAITASLFLEQRRCGLLL